MQCLTQEVSFCFYLVVSASMSFVSCKNVKLAAQNSTEFSSQKMLASHANVFALFSKSSDESHRNDEKKLCTKVNLIETAVRIIYLTIYHMKTFG